MDRHEAETALARILLRHVLKFNESGADEIVDAIGKLIMATINDELDRENGRGDYNPDA